MCEAMKVKTVRWAGRVAATLFLALLFLAFLSVFSTTFGYGYLPSTYWADATSSIRMVVGLVTALLSVVAVVKGLHAVEGEVRKIAAVLIAPFFGYFLGSVSILVSGPMVAAAVAGHHVELIYKVAEANGKDHRGCRSPVDLQGLPLFFKSLCRVSDDLRLTLAPGTQIVIEGRGTSLGAYVTAFHHVGS
ncbi:hypothetical protein PH562_03580 [Rhizobium sp. CNPSo 4062]|uniref:hypothetical protein n=1 Tax=Rhizobium sp. CNPSo 4062 TaxID=3021410 RepID=UPI00254B25C5|nr:hypothetical protein [Rhizobium sp. CNPSo 4062]MDK4701304.1 hypothetical protein [Rhizobium sp. CNPSo 4062]